MTEQTIDKMELLSNDTANDTFVPAGSMEDFSRPTVLLVLELTRFVGMLVCVTVIQN